MKKGLNTSGGLKPVLSIRAQQNKVIAEKIKRRKLLSIAFYGDMGRSSPRDRSAETADVNILRGCTAGITARSSWLTKPAIRSTSATIEGMIYLINHYHRKYRIDLWSLSP
ncbi:hypothetical protein [Paenibacillus sp. UNC496MF]|uniref:hypothetical protein n=1 Tax=Paenibacillus sp. UNC496MF TaxID=1502753 RepID=UPI001C42EF44|nr:hypothetical protein [Paenibacillus sp. UNC496MF]